ERLKHGIAAPDSGSIALNSKTVAEQIGAQIFIDGWAMVSPGDPERAADLAKRAGSVSHDGESVYGAQVIAAMEAQAFVERDLNKLIDTAVGLIPRDSLIYKLIADIREWHAAEPDWYKTRAKIDATYGYSQYLGGCHIVPNHALIIFALLYGGDDFRRSLMIVNTSGCDTDCNSGNVGCLLGIKNGLAGIDQSADWRTPIADRLYLATADGGRAITDAVTETYNIVNVGRALNGLQPIHPKNGARFHFTLTDSAQGFTRSDGLPVQNAGGRLALLCAPEQTVRVSTATFIPPDAIQMPGYALMASPTLYPGQTIRAHVAADASNPAAVDCALFLSVYGKGDQLQRRFGTSTMLAPGGEQMLTWTVGDSDGCPVAEVGLELRSSGTVYLDWLTWDGAPDVVLRRPTSAQQRGGRSPEAMWFRAWVNGLDQFEPYYPEAFRIIQNEGRGLAIQGTREWRDYRVSAKINFHMATAAGIGARVQGMKRYYALLLCGDGKVRLIKALDGDTLLAENDFGVEFAHDYDLALEVEGNRLKAWVDDRLLFDLADTDRPLEGGAVALICEEGRAGTDEVRVAPLSAPEADGGDHAL
ncbi:MAG TPA: ADP-ribosylglycohydrolase family protein, partial [Phototrophicaceae bacterium]|nr:ADP-ribosylglycohydrolase family protein [Phototrophicaceae bacterium]